MSLVQHVSAQDGFDREPDTASLQLGRRRSLSISYDPLPNFIQPSEKFQTAGAYEYSTSRRIVQVIVGVISCVLASGIVFGYAALKYVLVEEKVYRDLCTETELRDGDRICYMQDQRLNLTFIIASMTTNISALPIGTLLDRYGPRFCGLAGSILLLLGALCFSFAAQLPFDAYILGQFLLAFGGTFIFVPSFQLSNAFPQFQGLILALITGAFDASASVFLALRLTYESTGGTLSVQRFFLIYLAVPVFIFLSQLFIMPQYSYETRTELSDKLKEARNPALDLHDSDDELATDAELWRVRSLRHDARESIIADLTEMLGTKAERQEHAKREAEKRESSGVWGALHGVPASEQLRSPWFILIALLTVVQMARMNFFIATIWSQYRYMLDSFGKATMVNDFFDIALPIGGVAAVPFIGLVLDNTSMGGVLGILVFVSTVTGIVGVIPSLPAAYINVILFVLFRPFYYSAMSDYAAKVFGFATFGTVYGAIISSSGICTLAQSALQALMHDAFDDDPTPINIALAVLGLVVGAGLVSFVVVKGQAIPHEHATEGERQRLLPDDGPRQRLRPKMSARTLSTVLEARVLEARERERERNADR